MATDAKPGTVLHVIAHMEKGGAERQLTLLVGASRHQHVIAVLPGNQKPSPVAVELLPGLSPLEIYRSIRRMIRENDVEIVQLWLPDRITIPAMMAARREGCRIVSGDRRRVRNYGSGAVRDRLPYLNHLAADLIIPNYPHFLPRMSLRRVLGIPRRTHMILNGLDIEAKDRPITSVPDRLLFVGRLVEQKRVGKLVETMPELMSKAGIVGLDIVGDGPEEEHIRQTSESLGLGETVRLHGRLTDWGSCFDPGEHILVLPSASEGMSNTLFEAIAWGYLTMVSQSPELSAILRDWSEKPIMFKHDAPDTLIAAAHSIRTRTPRELNSHLQGMQARLSDFSVARMAAAYDDVYDALLRPGAVVLRSGEVKNGL